MKILHLIYDDLNNPWLGGGGAVRTQEIYKRFPRKHEVTVISGNYPGAKEEEEMGGVLYKRVGSDKNYLLSRISYPLNAPKVVKKAKHDILIEDFSGYSPCFSPLYTKNTVVASVQNLYGAHTIKQSKLLGLFPFVFEAGLMMYRNFVVVSPSIKNQLKGKIFKKCKVEVIPCGIDDSLFSLRPFEENYVLFLGRIDMYQKGIDILLKAFSRFVKKHKDTRLVIAGGGKDISKMQGLIHKLRLEDKVKYVGRVSAEEKGELLSRSLFICTPSRFESLGLVSLEASACEKPVIGTKIPGLCYAIKDGETGILIAPNSFSELDEAMSRLIEDKELRNKFGKNGRNWAKNFNWDNVAKKQEKFYLESINSSSEFT